MDVTSQQHQQSLKSTLPNQIYKSLQELNREKKLSTDWLWDHKGIPEPRGMTWVIVGDEDITIEKLNNR